MQAACVLLPAVVPLHMITAVAAWLQLLYLLGVAVSFCVDDRQLMAISTA